MNKFLIFIILGLLLISCNKNNPNNNNNNNNSYRDDGEQKVKLQNDSLHLPAKSLRLDHIFILIDSTNNVHQEFVNAGLTSAENWTSPHPQQGTIGEYFFFLNFYFEFLYISNSEEAIKNIENFGSNYVYRSKWKDSNYFPFGLGFVLNDSTKAIPFDTHTYKAEWMGKDNVFKMSKSNEDLNEPIVFVEPKEWANEIFENIEQLQTKENIEDREYRRNNLGLKKLTKVILVIPKKEEQFSQTLNELNELENIEIKSGEEPLLVLEFDETEQKKELDFEKKLRIKIKY